MSQRSRNFLWAISMAPGGAAGAIMAWAGAFPNRELGGTAQPLLIVMGLGLFVLSNAFAFRVLGRSTSSQERP